MCCDLVPALVGVCQVLELDGAVVAHGIVKLPLEFHSFQVRIAVPEIAVEVIFAADVKAVLQCPVDKANLPLAVNSEKSVGDAVEDFEQRLIGCDGSFLHNVIDGVVPAGWFDHTGARK